MLHFPTYDDNKPLVLHLLDGDIIDETRNDCARSLFANINLLLKYSLVFLHIAIELYIPRRKDRQHQGAFSLEITVSRHYWNDGKKAYHQ